MSASATDSPLFDRWSQTYDRPALQRLAYRPIHDVVLRRVLQAQPTSVLDLGCGTGQLTERLADSLPRVRIVGLDLSAGMLGEAARRLDRAGGPWLVRADAEWLPFAVASFDTVVCTESFHWYPDQARALDQIARVLRPGGQLLIASIATVTDIGDRLLRQATGASGNPVRALPPRRLRRLLVRSGFAVVEQRRIPRAGLVPWPVLTEARANAG